MPNGIPLHQDGSFPEIMPPPIFYVSKIPKWNIAASLQELFLVLTCQERGCTDVHDGGNQQREVIDGGCFRMMPRDGRLALHHVRGFHDATLAEVTRQGRVPCKRGSAVPALARFQRSVPGDLVLAPLPVAAELCAADAAHVAEALVLDAHVAT